MKARRESSENIRCDPLNQNSDQSDQEKWSTSKSGPVFSKLFRLDWTDPLSLGLKFPEILVQWITPIINSLPSPSPPPPPPTYHFLFQPRFSISTWMVRLNELRNTYFNLEPLSSSSRPARPGISTVERLWNGFYSEAELFLHRI